VCSCGPKDAAVVAGASGGTGQATAPTFAEKDAAVTRCPAGGRASGGDGTCVPDPCGRCTRTGPGWLIALAVRLDAPSNGTVVRVGWSSWRADGVG
jgi:hypothetical protein